MHIKRYIWFVSELKLINININSASRGPSHAPPGFEWPQNLLVTRIDMNLPPQEGFMVVKGSFHIPCMPGPPPSRDS